MPQPDDLLCPAEPGSVPVLFSEAKQPALRVHPAPRLTRSPESTRMWQLRPDNDGLLSPGPYANSPLNAEVV